MTLQEILQAAVDYCTLASCDYESKYAETLAEIGGPFTSKLGWLVFTVVKTKRYKVTVGNYHDNL